MVRVRRRLKPLFLTLATVAGACLIVAGCALVAAWLGMIVGGALLLAAGLFADDGTGPPL